LTDGTVDSNTSATSGAVQPSTIPHGVGVLEIENGQIVGIDAFLDPALLPRFGVAIASSP